MAFEVNADDVDLLEYFAKRAIGLGAENDYIDEYYIPVLREPVRSTMPSVLSLLIFASIWRFEMPITSAIPSAVTSGFASINSTIFCCVSFIPRFIPKFIPKSFPLFAFLLLFRK